MKKNAVLVPLAVGLWVAISTTILFSCKKQEVLMPVEQTFPESLPEYYEENELINVPAFDEGQQPAAGDLQDPLVGALEVYQRKNLLFNYGTESPGSLTLFAPKSLTQWNFAGKCCSYSIQRSSAFARTGGYATRFELRKTDGDVGFSKRAELSRSSKDDPPTKYERWYGASYYLPTDYANDVSPEAITQWHSNIGSPPLALWVKDGRWKVVKFGNQVSDVGAVQKGRWTDFVYHVKWSSATDGLVEVWKNGVKIYSRAGQSMPSGLSTGVYMKTGIYKWQWKSGTYSSTTKRTLFIDDVRIGNALASYKDVAP